MSLLQVPLQATNYPLNGREHIEMWVNGEQVIVEAPFWPYFMAKESAIEWDRKPEYKSEVVTVSPISTLKPIKAMKYSFPTVDHIRKLNNTQLKKWEEQGKCPIVENHIGFLERVAIDQPDFFKQYPNTRNELFIFDIETLSKKGEYFHDIISIAISDGKETWYEDVSGDTSESDLLEWFIGHWKRIDPDIIIGYNHKRFDLPRIFEACERNAISINWIGRDGKIPKLTEDYRLEKGIIIGRCVFDVWEDVDADQTLHGKVKNKKLKTIAKYFGISAITEETSDTWELLQQPKKLRRYNESDVNATMQIFERYLHQSTTIANQLGYPFDEIVNPKGARKGIERTQKGRTKEGITTLIGRIVGARGMGQRGFVEDGKNTQRYFSIYANRGKDSKGKLNPVYQGAIVGLYRDGVMLPKGDVLGELYTPVLHTDYCFSDDTEILTHGGWTNISKWNGELVATLNLQTDNIEMQKPIAYHINSNCLEMYHIEGIGIDQLITPNHTVIYNPRNRDRKRHITGKKGNPTYWSKEYKKVEIQNAPDFISIPSFGKWNEEGVDELTIGDYTLDADAFIEWYGWFVTEGSLNYRDGNEGITVTQSHPDHIDSIRQAFENLGIPYTETTYERKEVNSYGTIYQLNYPTIYRFYIGRKFAQAMIRILGPGFKSHHKFIHRILLNNMSNKQCKVMMKAMIDGDGHISKRDGHMRFDTSSKQLADDFQELSLKAGYGATVIKSSQTHDNREFVMYVVGISEFRKNVIRKCSGHVKRELYDRKSYCITVKNGSVICRRNGKVSVSGNSGMYPRIQMEANISPETVKLVALEPYDLSVWPHGLVRSRTDTHVTLVIPDNNFFGVGKNAIIEIDQSFQGGFPEFLRELHEARAVVKTLYNQAKAAGNKAEEIKYYSMQYSLKVIGNACGYGSNVRPETRYGSLIVGVVITGLARYMLGSATDFMQHWEPPRKTGRETPPETAVV